MNTNIIKEETYDTIEIISDDLTADEMKLIEKEIDAIYLTNKESIIINLKGVKNIDSESLIFLSKWHHSAYDNEKSLAFAEANDSLLKKIKQEQLHLLINICPTQIEAVDIVSMEMLERDLMKEEE